MARASNPLICYYGDDFTGSTDALECLSLAGAKAVLFIKPPSPEKLAEFGKVDAVGIAGMTRSMSPNAMTEALAPALSALRLLKPRHVHYKVCSTFDSSPTVGSIGRAIEVGRKIFPGPFVPLVVGAPQLGRYCVFGNLFARLGGDGPIYRLDRHPSMSRHPITPADESDLRLHLARQTDRPIGLFNILKVELPAEERAAQLEAILADGAEIVLFDALRQEQLTAIGALVDNYANGDAPLFSVGSSGVDMALGAHWSAKQIWKPKFDWASPEVAEPLLVASGSCSPVTAGQIDWALNNGFEEVPIETTKLVKSSATTSFETDALDRVVQCLHKGRSVVVHTSRGPSDPRLLAAGSPTAGLGRVLGRIVRQAIEVTSVRRLLIAGGDTSGLIALELGVESLEMIAPITPGAPLCLARGEKLPNETLEINFKGGQVGSPDYFRLVQQGTSTTDSTKKQVS